MLKLLWFNVEYQPLVINIVKSAEAFINNIVLLIVNNNEWKKTEEKREIKRDKDGNIIEEETEVEVEEKWSD